MRKFCKEVSGLGYNAVSLDDVAHLYHHPLHDEVLRQRIAFLRKEFHQLFQIARDPKDNLICYHARTRMIVFGQVDSIC
jgi:hypothetical protein